MKIIRLERMDILEFEKAHNFTLIVKEIAKDTYISYFQEIDIDNKKTSADSISKSLNLLCVYLSRTTIPLNTNKSISVAVPDLFYDEKINTINVK